MSENLLDQESAFARRRRLYEFIRAGQLGQEVFKEVLPNGEPHQYENVFWDYKIELPTLSQSHKPSDAERDNYNLKMAEIVKDAVSFYNSYGGYLVIGIRNEPREVVGYNKSFDCDELNKKIKAATKHDVDCMFTIHTASSRGNNYKIGIVFIPQRQDNKEPAQFLRDAPTSDQGYKAYKKHDIYFRQGHECKAAQTSDDYSFLCSPGRRQIDPTRDINVTIGLSNNLGPRDPGFISFIGRENYLQELWRWLCDRFSSSKLLAGLGGVGKTTLAREFAEDVIRNSALGFECVIWLSAKQRFYTAILDQYVPATRVDFIDVKSLLRTLLLELGYIEDELDPEWTRSELIDEVVQTLRILPSFVVIDDIDSLNPGQQNEVFHTILQVMNTTIGTAPVPSRALLTARLDLGASPAQLIRVTGLNPPEFYEYVQMIANSIGLNLNIGPSSRLIERFHKVTDGSPTFAASILRFLRLGVNLPSALDTWRGSDGEEVRKFAFEKELSNLTESQVRTLYAACILGDTSVLELQQITQSNSTLLQDDLGELRKYHLLALGNDLLRGGARLIVPSGIRLMGGLIRGRLRDPSRIERECARVQSVSPKLEDKADRILRRVIALWRDQKPEDALEVVSLSDKQYRNNPNLKCLLGRAYLELNPANPQKADVAFRKAYELGCSRAELINLWVEAKRLREDWLGILEITQLEDRQTSAAEKVYFRAEAFSELGQTAEKTGNLNSAIDYYGNAIEEINEAFAKGYARGRVVDLNNLNQAVFQNYIRLIDITTTDRQEHIIVWFAVMRAFGSRVRRSDFIRLGIERLDSWWRAVEGREKQDKNSARLMKEQLMKIDNVKSFLKRSPVSNIELLKLVQAKKDNLNKRWHHYNDSLSIDN